MRNQLQRHIVITFGTKQRVFAEAIEETLLKRFFGHHSVASGVIGHLGRYNIGQLFSHFLIAYIAVQSVITDSVKSLWQEASSDEVGPSVGIDLGTGKTEAGFAGKGDSAYFSTVAASVLNKTHLFGIAAVEHLLDSVVVVGTVKAWTKLLKRIPVIIENLFKCVFVNAFHGCSLRTTIPELTK